MDLAYPDFDELGALFRSPILHCIVNVVPFVHLWKEGRQRMAVKINLVGQSLFVCTYHLIQVALLAALPAIIQWHQIVSTGAVRLLLFRFFGVRHHRL